MAWSDLQRDILEEFQDVRQAVFGHTLDPLVLVATHATELQKEYIKEYVKRPEVAARIKAAGRVRVRAPLTDPIKIEKRLAQKRAYAKRAYLKRMP